MNHPEHSRNGGSDLVVSRYSEQQIAEFNRKHDIENGWSPEMTTVYVNRNRLPETVVSKPDKVWETKR